VNQLKDETEDFLDRGDDQQLWYNRGYANGVVNALDTLGYSEFIDSMIIRDPADLIRGHEALPWGQAYKHGTEMGEKETREVIGPAPAR
jgi:hypothetical protein